MLPRPAARASPAWLASTALASLMLAGCAGGAGGEDGPDADFTDLGLVASETTGIIRGIVVDEAVRPVGAADVLLTPGDVATQTTPEGTFGFSGLAPGTYFLRVSRGGFNETQTSAEVVAGLAEPPIVKVVLLPNPATVPYLETFQFGGFMNIGVSIGITSVGTTTFQGTLGEDVTIWNVNFTVVPRWAQGELLWEHNQPGGGMLIWEMTVGGSNDFKGYRETAESPTLAYWNTTVLAAEADAGNLTDEGVDYRFFGGPHPALAPGAGVIPPEEQCPWIDTGPVLGPRNPCRFGYGLTTQQRADAYVHHFYNFLPPEGWRFTSDGDPPVPPA